jgi:S-DNA-T family DNA segregation ATPase FtsK/SpoIIIE
MLQVMRDAAAAGYTVLLAGDRALLGIRIAATLERKFVLELLDRSDFGMAGIPAAALPRTFSAGRAICAEDSSEVQFALLAPDPQPLAQWQEVSRVAAAAARPDPASRPMQVRPLPNRISAAEIRPGIGMALLLLLGVGGDAAEPVTIDLLGADRRFLVTGPPRSGRSTTLITIGAQAVRLRQPVIVVAGERSPLSSWARHAGIGCHDPAAQDSTELHRCIDDEPQAIVLVDDAEELGDTSSDLLIEVAARYEHPMAVTVRSDDLQISFRGLAVDIRRHRTGLLLQPTGADAELLAIRSRAGRSLRAPGSGLLVTAATREGWPDGLPVQVMHQ